MEAELTFMEWLLGARCFIGFFEISCRENEKMWFSGQSKLPKST